MTDDQRLLQLSETLYESFKLVDLPEEFREQMRQSALSFVRDQADHMFRLRSNLSQIEGLAYLCLLTQMLGFLIGSRIYTVVEDNHDVIGLTFTSSFAAGFENSHDLLCPMVESSRSTKN